jgi:arylsulfatase A-like enzyme
MPGPENIGGILSQVKRGALAGLAWGAAAGAMQAAVLFAATRDTLQAPGGAILGIAQAAAVDAAALWLILLVCGAVIGLAACASRHRLGVLDRPYLYSCLALGAISFGLILRIWASAAGTAGAWFGSACAGAAVAAAAALALPPLGRRWAWVENPGPGVIFLVPLAAAGASAAAYLRWGIAPLWLRTLISATGLAALLVLLIIAARWLRVLGSRVHWWPTAAAVLPAPALAIWLGLSALHSSARPPVILITIDALRADRLGCYGSRGGLTPNLDAFARDAIVFEHAFASAPWTANSFAAIFTGRYPYESAMAPPAPAVPRPTPVRWFGLRGVHLSPPLLQEVLHEAGYTTATELANPALDRCAAWDKGFEYYRNEYAAMPESRSFWAPRRWALLGWHYTTLTGWFVMRPDIGRTHRRIFSRSKPPCAEGASVTAAALQWLADHAQESPFFLWVHYIDPHYPYRAPDLPQRVLASLPQEQRQDLLSPRARTEGGGPRPETPEPLRAASRTLYGYEVRYADRRAGELLAYLRRAGIYKRALIIISADHGEELWDHNGVGHGHTLYDELLRVPLLVKLPGRSPRARVKRQVRLLDLMPTILEVTGVPYRGPLRGRSLLAALRSDDRERPLFAEGLLHGDEQKCLRTERYKVIYHAATGRSEVYDLRADPREQRDLGGNQTVAARERALLKAWMATAAGTRVRVSPKPKVTAEMRERLRALGYITK